MSGYSDTSREAFARVDATAGQRRVLAVFRNGMTRQDIADTGIPINVVCPRIRELLDAKTLKELPAVDGKHPLQLIEQTERGLHGSAANGKQYPDVVDGHSERDEEGTAVSRVAPETRSFTNTSSESHRHECEIRYCINLPSDAARNKYLTLVHEKRGSEAWKRLRQAVLDAMKVAA